MRKLFKQSSLCITAGSVVSGIVDQAATLQIASGFVWITVEGSSEDYCLKTGESLSVVAGRLILIEAIKTNSIVNLSHFFINE